MSGRMGAVESKPSASNMESHKSILYRDPRLIAVIIPDRICMTVLACSSS